MSNVPAEVLLLVAALLVLTVPYACGRKDERNNWCRARFAAAHTAVDSIAIVRDTLPRGCKLQVKP